LTDAEAEAGPLAAVRKMWRELPRPDQVSADAVRRGCERMRDLVVRLRRPLKPQVGKLRVGGIFEGSQPLGLWRNRQLASRHRSYSGEVSHDLRKLAEQLKDADAELAKLFVLKDTDAETQRRLRRELERFCAVFPDAFFVSDRGPYFDPKAAG